MLSSRKIYRFVRTIFTILTILSMLGISVKIFADGLSVFDKMRLFNNDIYESMEDYQKACLLENKDNYNFIYYNPTSKSLTMRNISSLGEELSDSFKYYSPGLSIVSNSTGNCKQQNISQNIQNYGYNNSYVYKFVVDNSNYVFVFKNTYEVNIIISGNGEVSGSGIYNKGENVIINAIPYENNVFVGWFSDSDLLDLVSNESEYTINNIESDITLYAQFIELGDNPDSDKPIIYNSDDYKYLTSICIIVCMMFWNNVLKEYL